MQGVALLQVRIATDTPDQLFNKQGDVMLHPILYKRTSTGAVQVWRIELMGDKYRTISGQQSGKLVTSQFTTAKPMSAGRSNATTGTQQAFLEVKAAYTKKLAQGGYHETIEEIDNAKFFKPMLAKKYEDYLLENFKAVFSQPKLDGIRNLANKKGLWSRQGKPITSCPHIIRALIPFFEAHPEGVLDGELYADKLSDNFSKIVSLVRKQDPTAHELAESSCYISYHVYDYPSAKGDFYDRYKQLLADLPDHPHLKLVETTGCIGQETLDTLFAQYLEQGYEGQIIRIGGISYEQKRSKFLLKRKEFQDAEFEILDIVEGEGNRSGMAGKVWYKWKGTDKFSSGLRGSHEYCKQLLKDKSKYTKGTGTVRFQGYNPEDGKPRFPVTVALFTGKRDV